MALGGKGDSLWEDRERQYASSSNLTFFEFFARIGPMGSLCPTYQKHAFRYEFLEKDTKPLIWWRNLNILYNSHDVQWGRPPEFILELTLERKTLLMDGILRPQHVCCCVCMPYGQETEYLIDMYSALQGHGNCPTVTELAGMGLKT